MAHYGIASEAKVLETRIASVAPAPTLLREHVEAIVVDRVHHPPSHDRWIEPLRDRVAQSIGKRSCVSPTSDK